MNPTIPPDAETAARKQEDLENMAIRYPVTVHTETRVSPRIFVFCNNCSHEWHAFAALSEDGVFLAGHVCSDHRYAPHDMGSLVDGWKREIYARHYPEGFEVVIVDDPSNHAEVRAAYQRHVAHDEDDYAAKVARLSDGERAPVPVVAGLGVDQG